MDWLLILLIVFYIISGLLIFLLNKKREGIWKFWKVNRTVSFLMISNFFLILFLGLNSYMNVSEWLKLSLMIFYLLFLGCAIIYEVRKNKMKKNY